MGDHRIDQVKPTEKPTGMDTGHLLASRSGLGAGVDTRSANPTQVFLREQALYGTAHDGFTFAQFGPIYPADHAQPMKIAQGHTDNVYNPTLQQYADGQLITPAGKIHIGGKTYNGDQIIAQLPDESSDTNAIQIAQARPDEVYNPAQQLSDQAIDIANKTKQGHDKLLPKEGETIKFDKLLTEYKTPFIDAYDKSTLLKSGKPGKSETLEEAVNRLKDCPWADKIQVKFDSTAEHPEYDPIHNTITINPKHSPGRQIEEFVHESYHATHQSIVALNLPNSPLTQDKYLQARAKDEVGSFVAEIKVHDELTGSMPGTMPVEFEYVQNGHAAIKDLSALYHQHGAKALEDFLLDAKPPVYEHGVAQVDWLTQELQTGKTYRQYYTASYDDYLKTFPDAHVQALSLENKWLRDHKGTTKADFVKADY